MRLTLNVLRCPDAAVPESRSSNGADIAIGRGLDCDWVLQDPDRVLSKRHCVLEFRGGYWQVRDTSTNGTFLNNAPEPVGRDMVAPISDGDRLRFGSYEVELRVAAETGGGAWGGGGQAAAPGAARDAAMPWGEAAIGSSGGPGRPAADPFGDPFAPPPGAGPSQGGFGGGSLPGTGSDGLPDDWDPLAEGLAPMPDHTPSASDAFVPPHAAPLPPAGGIPEDWDPFGDTPPGAPAAPPVAQPAPSPLPGPAAPPGDLPSDWDPLADLDAPAAPPPRPAPAPPASPPVVAAPVAAPVAAAPPAPPPEPMPVAEPAPFAVSEDTAESLPPPAEERDPFAEEGVPSRSIPAPGDTPVAPPARAMPTAEVEPAAALAALLRGAGLSASALHGADPVAVFEQTGAALRAAVNGLRALLIARADVKREFRIEQTMLRAVGNNPLKFAASDEAAIAALVNPAAQGPRAVAETIGDLTAHEVATLAATQAAARALLARLAPEVVEEADAGGSLFGSREKRLWDAYRKLHGKVTEQFEDDFDSAFGKEFARAYEQAVAKSG